MTEPDGSPARELAYQLARAGDLSSDWRPAFEAVPRHVFIPATIWRTESGAAPDGGKALVPLHYTDDPAAWMRCAYALAPVVTQVDDGEPTYPHGRGRYSTSSASHPVVVADMLNALDVQSGMRVCEIGTGTGYNAALLAHRCGDANVTTVEVDAATAEHARSALQRANRHPLVVTADGANGYPPNAPFDRILCTAAVQTVPYSWVEQARPGGIIVTPWGTPYYNGALIRLVVEAGGIARGRIVGNAAFMFLQSQRVRAAINDDESHEAAARKGSTTLTPSDVAGDPDPAFAIGIRVPGASTIYLPAAPGAMESRLWIVDPASESWANTVHVPGDSHYRTHQSGPRDLWTEVEDAFRWWQDHGQPAREDWIITVDGDGQTLDLPGRH